MRFLSTVATREHLASPQSTASNTIGRRALVAPEPVAWLGVLGHCYMYPSRGNKTRLRFASLMETAACFLPSTALSVRFEPTEAGTVASYITQLCAPSLRHNSCGYVAVGQISTTNSHPFRYCDFSGDECGYSSPLYSTMQENGAFTSLLFKSI